MKTTAEMVYELITQNTGRHFLDSGGAYGRHWERNQKYTLEDFKAFPQCVLRASIYSGRLELEVTKSLFHHLVGALSYCEELDELWQKFDAHFSELYWDETMNMFYRWAKKHDSKFHDHYDFEGESYHGYTYNDENILSQDFIYHQMGSYVFIQTHNGCDARGGFSRPHIFQFKEDEYALFNYNDYTIGCKNGHWWDFGGNEDTEQPILLLPTRYGRGKPVAEVIDGDDDEFIAQQEDYADQMKQWQAQKRCWDKMEPLPGMEKPDFAPVPELLAGKIVVKDHTATCPCCGEQLEAWSY